MAMNNDLEWLHIYGQGAWHDDVYIVGNEIALMKLKDVIEGALTNQNHQDNFFVSDGEGYCVKVSNVDNIEKYGSPYWEEVAQDKNPNALYPWLI